MKSSAQDSPHLSVAIIVRDAADLLAATLDSVRAIADEIVVVDTGSSDRTVETARRGADIVEQIEWQDSFAIARNECLRYVTGDWVLWLDAGETIDDVPAQQLRTFVDDTADSNKAYMLFIQRPGAGSTSSIEQIGQVRLAPNREDVEFCGRVRETTLPSLRAAGMGVDAVDCAIRRDSEDREPARQRARALRNLNLVNLAAHDGPENVSMMLARAEAFGLLERWNDAAAAFRAALAKSAHGSSEMLEAYYGLLTAMDANVAADNQSRDQVSPRGGNGSLGETAPLGLGDEQMMTCLEALEAYPLDAQLLCGMGSYLLRGQRLDLAARSYETAIVHGTVDPATWHLADVADAAVICLALVRQLLGDGKRAEQIVCDALVERPDSLRLRRQMIEICVKAGREREALQHCRLLPAEAPSRADLPAVVRGAVLAGERKSAAAIPILQSAYDAGCRDPLCLRWLAAAYLAEGNLVEVGSIAEEWALCDPGSLEIGAFRKAVADRNGNRDNSLQQGTRLGALRRTDARSVGPLPIEMPPFGPRSTTTQY